MAGSALVATLCGAFVTLYWWLLDSTVGVLFGLPPVASYGTVFWASVASSGTLHLYFRWREGRGR